MYMCVFIYIYIYMMCVCIYECVCACMCLFVCVCVCVCVFMYIYVCMCVWQEAMVSELKNRNREIKEKRRLLKQDEVYHGALEDILLGRHWLHEDTASYCSSLSEVRVQLPE